MKKTGSALSFAALFYLCSCSGTHESISLQGTWRFQLAPGDKGLAEQPYPHALSDSLTLPGSLQEQGKGYDIGVSILWTGQIVDRSWYTSDEYAEYRKPGNIKVPFWLNPDKHYVGAAWYQKDIDIPESWKGRTLAVELERAHWATRLFIDRKEYGANQALQVPHRYFINGLQPGRHTLTLLVDNRLQTNVGINAHSVTDHTQSNWNGLTGFLTLSAKPARYINRVEIYPDTRSGKAKVCIYTEGDTATNATVRLQVTDGTSGRKVADSRVRIPAGAPRTIETTIAVENARLWSEHTPAFYDMDVSLATADGTDRTRERFGFHDFKAEGTRFTVNGVPTFLRGTLECCVFPQTGYPPTDTDYWTKIYSRCKAYGLNHVRFHSWCPPEAAFLAADSLGVYLQVECGGWTQIGSGGSQDTWLREEGDRILAAYGNHPSFVMMEYGNEPNGGKMSAYLSELVKYWKKKDTRRVYAGSAGWPYLPEADYFNPIEPRIQGWGAGLTSRINACPPSTDYDFRNQTRSDMPTVSHEVGQWCVYPNFNEIGKYTGVLKAKNLEIFRESLARKGMAKQADPFLYASGRLQTLCYKADIEAALRTPGFGGFQLLGLNDFPGQGTALVGVLDAFWDEKGYVDGPEFRTFCDTTVVLARFPKMIWLNNERLEVPLEVAHFGTAPLSGATVTWAITSATTRDTLWSGSSRRDLPIGNGFEAGTLRCDLSSIRHPVQLTVHAGIVGHASANSWHIWVYPASVPDAPAHTHIATRFDEDVQQRLERGEDVLLLPYGHIRPEQGGNIATGFSSIFWNTAWTGGQAPHTLGILCDPAHPALAQFPNEGVSDWQWWDLMSRCQAMVLDDFPQAYQPVVQIIDDWFKNRKLGLVCEARVGNGRLLVCSADLTTDLDNRPAARQLRRSLLRYMQSDRFQPGTSLDSKDLQKLFSIE